MAGLASITGGIGRAIDGIQTRTEDLFFDPVIRLGVTGLSRAGKTVFITSLVANLLNPGRMGQLRAVADCRVEAAWLQPQPNDAVARFAFEDHLAALTGPTPHWPQSTRTISQLRLSLRVRPTGFLTGLTGARTIHIDIIDYPGEWLLDLPLLHQSFAQWSAAALAQATLPGRDGLSAAWRGHIEAMDVSAPLDEVSAQTLARAFTGYLNAARAAGYSDCAPGRFLLPGDMDGSPALTFCPLPNPDKKARDGTLFAAFERRFESYKRLVVRPFFRDHFSRIDRQVVLVDVLGAINAGPRAVEDLRSAMADILGAFRPGPNTWLSSVLGRRVERIVFAATKADHLHHTQHQALSDIVDALVADARARAVYKGADVRALALAAVRATTEETLTHQGAPLDCVRGVLADTGAEAALHAGALPEDPMAIMAPARAGQARWLDGDFAAMSFLPPALSTRPGEGPPHIRLDRAAEFLLGDRLL